MQKNKVNVHPYESIDPKKVEEAYKYVVKHGEMVSNETCVTIKIDKVPLLYQEACSYMCIEHQRKVFLIAGKDNVRIEFLPLKNGDACVTYNGNSYIMTSDYKRKALPSAKNLYDNDIKLQ